MAKTGATIEREEKLPNYNGCEVTIKSVDNGVVVTVRSSNYEEESTHVFKTLEDALKEVPSIISVHKEEKLTFKK